MLRTTMVIPVIAVRRLSGAVKVRDGLNVHCQLTLEMAVKGSNR